MFFVSESLFQRHFWDFFIIYALLSQDFDVEIYALFPQNFCDRKTDFANFLPFRMYECDGVGTLLSSEIITIVGISSCNRILTIDRVFTEMAD